MCKTILGMWDSVMGGDQSEAKMMVTVLSIVFMLLVFITTGISYYNYCWMMTETAAMEAGYTQKIIPGTNILYWDKGEE